MSSKEYTFSGSDFESSLSSFASKGITELTVHDEAITAHKGRLIHFMQSVARDAPDLFVTIPVRAELLDMDVCKAASQIYCTLELPLKGTSKGGAYLFDKKFYSHRAAMLNNMGLVFGFDIDFACDEGDAVKLFRDRLDFAVSLLPNHIDFPQLVEGADYAQPAPTATFSTQDIKSAKVCAFACESFYSFGRAVPWFLSILKPLQVSASRFFQDFAEWQRCNNCDFSSGWDAESAKHADIEKMQLLFLRLKYEEKNKLPLFAVVSDIVRLNGALSRSLSDSEESVLELSYNPDDLLGSESLSIASFADNVCMENTKVKIVMGDEGSDYRIL
jgi:hypothetical protein